jgi:hypothetical protein
MSPNTTPNAERLSAGRLEATTVLLWCKGALFHNADTFGRSTLPHFRSLLDKGCSRSATAGRSPSHPTILGRLGDNQGAAGSEGLMCSRCTFATREATAAHTITATPLHAQINLAAVARGVCAPHRT